LVEVDLWYNSVCKAEPKEISGTRELFRKSLSGISTTPGTSEASGIGTCTCKAPESRPLRLPQSLGSYEKDTYVCEGFGKLHSKCLPTTEQEESELLHKLVEELNAKCGLDLSSDINLDRLMGEQDEESPVFSAPDMIVMVGASHGVRIIDEMDSDRYQLLDLSSPGWKINEDEAERKAEELRDRLVDCDEQNTTVIFQLFDNNSFWVTRSDGSRVLPIRGEDRRYHADGNVEVADQSDAKRMVSKVTSLLRAAGGCRKVVLAPAPRYLHTPCCTDASHCANMARRGYGKEMKEKLADLRDAIKAAVKTKGIKRVSVWQPDLLLEGPEDNYLRDEEIWGDDPVHMTTTGYVELARQLEAKIEDWKGFEEREEKSNSGGDKRPMAKRARVDLTKQRPDWVRGNVGEAVRADRPGTSSHISSSRGWKPATSLRGGRSSDSVRGSRGGGRGHSGGQDMDRGRGRGRGNDRGGNSGRGGNRGPHRGHYGFKSRGYGQGRQW